MTTIWTKEREWSDAPGASAHERFTIYGDDAVEARIADLLRRVTARLSPELPPAFCRTLALIGGYGRGEGGVEIGPDGTQVPHNNFDFLVVTPGSIGAQEAVLLKQRLDAILAKAMADFGIELYLGVVSENTLRQAPRRVIWHDIVEGHKTLWGDTTLLPGLRRHADPRRILGEDVRDLLVNRGTLLLINDLILEHGDLALRLADRRVVLRHGMKAVLGYGDALLWSIGEYHWSYRERQRRMRKRGEIDRAFRERYEAAAEFRFRPCYEEYLLCDLSAWQEGLRSELEGVHRVFESRRLDAPVTTGWKALAQRALAAYLPTPRTDPRLAAKRVWNLVHGGYREAPEGSDLQSRCGLLCSAMRDLMPVLFPAVIYPATDDTALLRPWAAQMLEAANETPTALRRAYLRAWGRHGDVNFAHTLRVLGLSLEESKG